MWASKWASPNALAWLVVWTAAIFANEKIVHSQQLSAEQLELVRQVERQRIKAIDQVIGSVIAIYDADKSGGGSGVIIDPSGIALTNHHVIMGAGVEGWGGLADGKLYRWKLIGTDPGGDVSIIQMEGRDDFPFTPLGDSDEVEVGDWALAMGNPFILTEDQVPTVTLGIVSGVKRYQPGAGMNQLEYGNCIQVDSSINPGNSGGPLFNLKGEIIGINGRGSFKARGRVNVGLGYAISSNQIKNFIPDLLATKLVEHATLDAVFSERDGKVVCSTINLDATVAKLGLELGDELLEFEGTRIENANQFTNLICTIPENWPVDLLIRKKDGTEKVIVSRAFGLPYKKPPKPKQKSEGESEEEKQKIKRQKEMLELLSAQPGTIRFEEINRNYAQSLVARWRDFERKEFDSNATGWLVEDKVFKDGKEVGEQKIWLSTNGRLKVFWSVNGADEAVYLFDGKRFFGADSESGKFQPLSLVQAKIKLPLLQALAIAAPLQTTPFELFGEVLLDGGDEANRQNAYRFTFTDQDGDSLYCWLSMYGGNQRPEQRLLKVSPNMDCDQQGGVVFDDWKLVAGLKLAGLRRFVSGLAEEPQFEIRNESVTSISVEDQMFNVASDVAIPANDKVSNPEADVELAEGVEIDDAKKK